VRRTTGLARRRLLVGIALVVMTWPVAAIEAQNSWTFFGLPSTEWFFNGTSRGTSPIRLTVTQVGPLYQAGDVVSFCDVDSVPPDQEWVEAVSALEYFNGTGWSPLGSLGTSLWAIGAFSPSLTGIVNASVPSPPSTACGLQLVSFLVDQRLLSTISAEGDLSLYTNVLVEPYSSDPADGIWAGTGVWVRSVSVPEPGSAALLLSGLAGLGVAVRRRHRGGRDGGFH
jgi:hypothetical protein